MVFWKYIISVRGGHCVDWPRAPKHLATPLYAGILRMTVNDEGMWKWWWLIPWYIYQNLPGSITTKTLRRTAHNARESSHGTPRYETGLLTTTQWWSLHMRFYFNQNMNLTLDQPRYTNKSSYPYKPVFYIGYKSISSQIVLHLLSFLVAKSVVYWSGCNYSHGSRIQFTITERTLSHDKKNANYRHVILFILGRELQQSHGKKTIKETNVAK